VALFVQACLWLGIVLSPSLLGLLIGCMLAVQQTPSNLNAPLFGLALGALIGVIWAEYIRKVHGLSQFFGRLVATPDIDGRSSSKL
ncbi:hypothetical protein, partial [Shewanella sp.]|uniref:hypothetical protein n=1 Tax=Shewanella sp. TaxID=50422 RepID=UPI003D11FCE8